eukprot:COSAG01_NODE_2306_length_7946_cov_4.903148_12_plen_330_part_00
MTAKIKGTPTLHIEKQMLETGVIGKRNTEEDATQTCTVIVPDKESLGPLLYDCHTTLLNRKPTTELWFHWDSTWQGCWANPAMQLKTTMWWLRRSTLLASGLYVVQIGADRAQLRVDGGRVTAEAFVPPTSRRVEALHQRMPQMPRHSAPRLPAPSLRPPPRRWACGRCLTAATRPLPRSGYSGCGGAIIAPLGVAAGRGRVGTACMAVREGGRTMFFALTLSGQRVRQALLDRRGISDHLSFACIGDCRTCCCPAARAGGRGSHRHCQPLLSLLVGCSAAACSLQCPSSDRLGAGAAGRRHGRASVGCTLLCADVAAAPPRGHRRNPC